MGPLVSTQPGLPLRATWTISFANSLPEASFTSRKFFPIILSLMWKRITPDQFLDKQEQVLVHPFAAVGSGEVLGRLVDTDLL